MRQYNKIFPSLGMALYFCGAYLGAAFAAARQGYAVSGKIPSIAHLACLIAVCAALSLYLRRRQNRTLPRGLALWLAAVSLPCLALPFFFPGSGAISWIYLIYPACALGMFMPVGLHLFFAAVPRRRQGFVMGCALAAGELVWVSILPLLYLHISVAHSPEAVYYLYNFLCFAVAGSGLCLAAGLADSALFRAFAARFGQAPLTTPGAPSAPDAPAIPAIPPIPADARKALLLLFAAAGLFAVLFGLAFGEMPRTSVSPRLSGISFLLLLIPPLAGALLDAALFRSSRPSSDTGLSRLASFLVTLPVLAVPVLGLTLGFGFSGPLPFVLSSLRLVLQVALFTLTARLVGRSPFSPLIAVCVWYLMYVQLAGVGLAHLFAASPGLRVCAAFVLAFGVVIFLLRFSVAAKFLPQLREEEPEESPKEMMADAGQPACKDGANNATALPPAEERNKAARREEEAKIAAFAAVFSCTAREQEILERILNGGGNAAIATEFGISEATVRFHLGSLLKKTGMTNRKRLTHFYTLWKAE